MAPRDPTQDSTYSYERQPGLILTDTDITRELDLAEPSSLMPVPDALTDVSSALSGSGF